MKFNKEERINLDGLSTKISKLLVKIAEEKLPKEKIPTELDIKYMNTISEIKEISPMLANRYLKNYNEIQRQKIDDNSSYLKRLGENPLYGKEL